MDKVTNVNQARAIISEIGKPYQEYVYGELMKLFCYNSIVKEKREAQIVIENMEKEYVLNIANALLADKRDLLPDNLLRDWSNSDC